jgi:hypothetical protein
MQPENEDRLRKVRRISKVFRVVCKAFFIPPVLLCILSLTALLTGGSLSGFTTDQYFFRLSELSIRSRAILGAYYGLRWAAMFLFVYCLHRLLGNYSRGDIFSTDSSAQVRRWGFTCVFWGVMKFLFVFVPGAVLTHPHWVGVPDRGPLIQGVRMQTEGKLLVNGMFVQVHGGDLILMGLIVVGISWFMAMAGEMREEIELTV